MVNYKIIGFDKTIGVITVSFNENMSPVTIDVPLNENNEYITGQELTSYIEGFIPVWHLDRLNKIASGIYNESVIENLVTIIPKTENEIVNTDINNSTQHWAEIEAEKQIAKVLVKFGLLANDPTIINQTVL